MAGDRPRAGSEHRGRLRAVREGDWAESVDAAVQGTAQISMDRGPLGILATLAWLRRAREHSVSADLRFEEDMPPVITSPGLS